MARNRGKSKQPTPPTPQGISFKRWWWTRVFKLIGIGLKPLIFGVVATFCAYFMSNAMEAYAGKQSSANMNFFFGLVSNVSVTVGLAVTSNGIAFTLYFRERKLRKSLTVKFAKRIAELELQIDPERRSSRLLEDGSTRSEDL